MADSTISIGFKIEDAAGGLRKLTVDAEALRRAMRGAVVETKGLNTSVVNLAAFSASFDAATSFVSDLTKACRGLSEAYAVQEEAERKIAVVMQQRMGATEGEIQAIKDLCSAQQNLGVIGDEVQLAGAQQIATFLRQRESLETLIPAMNDLAAQQRGLNASQGDMVGIANLMGKAMQGQTSALRRVGITFSEAQEQVMKMGTGVSYQDMRVTFSPYPKSDLDAPEEVKGTSDNPTATYYSNALKVSDYGDPMEQNACIYTSFGVRRHTEGTGLGEPPATLQKTRTWSEFKSIAGMVMMPVMVEICSADGTVLRHYDNTEAVAGYRGANVVYDLGDLEPSYWKEGAGQWGCCWMMWYPDEITKESVPTDGWSSNRQPTQVRCTGAKVIGRLLQGGDGWRVKWPAVSGWLRIRVGARVCRDEATVQEMCREQGIEYVPTKARNGETWPQILVRTKQALMVSKDKWSATQRQRMEILFENYPQIGQAYKVMQRLRKIFNEKVDHLKGGAMLMKWFREVEALGREHFNTVVRTFKNNYKTIVNYFRSRATNASAESFNAKIKMFRTQLRGVSDPLFFIFRLCKLFA